MKSLRSSWLLFLAVFPATLASAAPNLDIKLDQVGYLPSKPKSAFLVSPQKTHKSFQVIDTSDQKVVSSGKFGAPLLDPDSGDRLQEADFSDLEKEGVYFIRVPGVGDSLPFKVSAGVYRDAYYLSLRSFYGQRCGTDVNMGPRFPRYHYEACHLKDGEFHRSSGKSGRTDSGKGWHDAGDYGKYIVNSGISTGTLLLTYDWYQDRIGRMDLDLPESGNTLPDILDEIKWNLDWMLTMQDGDGGVWHKLTTEKFCGFVMPKDDTDPRFIIGTGTAPFKNSTATGDFAAVMALAARIYRPFLPDYSKRCEEAALKAWRWVLKNPTVTFSNPSGVATGGYGDGHPGDEILWAAAELFSLTGKKEFGDHFAANYPKYLPSGSDPQAWPTVSNLAWWSYLFTKRPEADPAVQEDLRMRYLLAASEIVEATREVGYRHSLRANNYIWGSNAVAANYGLMLLAADRLHSDGAFQAAALDNLHYLLGRNTFGLCFVTHLGSRYPMAIHHRPSGADSVVDPWPGLIAGGPNRSPQDPGLKKLPPGLPPAKMFTDVEESYASNEIAINWNAPLVMLLSAFIPSLQDLPDP